MEIRLLKENVYKNSEEFYKSFLDGSILTDNKFFSEEFAVIESAPDFPIYMGQGSEMERTDNFLKAFDVLRNSYVREERDIHLNELFWHSLLVREKRNFVLINYPNVKRGYDKFKNVVIKDFDWENYIYKCVLATEYVEDHVPEELKDHYYLLIVKNLDLFNYIIKYKLFRNSDFLIKLLTIIDRLNLSEIMKAKIPNYPDNEDHRYGRKVIYELNKKYPVLLSPILDIDILQEEVLVAFSKYRDL